jgi:hypothetical protein
LLAFRRLSSSIIRRVTARERTVPPPEELGAGDVEVLVRLGVGAVERGVAAPEVLVPEVLAPCRGALGAVVRDGAVVVARVLGVLRVVVVVVVVLLAPQPATEHRTAGSANPRSKLFTARESTPSVRREVCLEDRGRPWVIASVNGRPC